ncbi:MAG TPA: ABC transporter permease [Spirochaetia bacterium]|nr:ABC transporter permease [Spirochaetales bacterium]HRY79284.1 ABC transporter permease [Spirochaetia bacterium]HRZ88548.1 ABC transporter permease [Spirochaetia bacterium]
MKRSMDLKRAVRDPKTLMLTLLVLLNLFFALNSEAFFSLENYFNMLKQSAMIIIVASAATILMMTGNFDLSTGSNLALTGVVYSLLLSSGMDLLPAALLAILCGSSVGIVNGLLVARIEFPPFIATLGTMYIARGLALILAGGSPVRGEKIPENVTILARGDWMGIPIPVYFLVLFVVLFRIVEGRSIFGKYSMTIGGNRNAAFYSGIPVGRIVFWNYQFVGILASFAGILMASRLAAGDPRIGVGFEFDVILAILLGGTSLKGGKGSVLGTLIGALIVAVLGNGLDMMNILTFWQGILKGIIFVLAIVVNEKILKNVGKASTRAA